MYRRYLLGFLFVFLLLGKISAEEISFTLEITGVTVNGGTVHGGVYSRNTYNTINPPEFSFRGNPISNTINISLQIPQGEYVIQIYQDTNNNGKLDFNFFGIPIEPIGISNWNGRGIPGNFNRHKVLIYTGLKIIVQLNQR